jgi:CheY-like chemotaxis protein/anti-sigma regulatory factor (Ser/Thr protein kinase)/class 3 adenylate cyclase
MDTPNNVIDLRIYRPASVLIIDLVKHSTRERVAVQAVQTAMEEVLEKAKDILKITEAHFNYTGDGYVCAFVGDSSARILDFINIVIPELARRLTAHAEQLRAGLDFGLVHLTRNALTGKYELFDLASIQAARLEQSAEPGQILCTETIQKIFGHHYPSMFSKASILVKTKDRDLLAFQLTPFGWEHITACLTDYLFGSRASGAEDLGGKKKVLFVDDEPRVQEIFLSLFEAEWPDYEVFGCSDGQQALELFRAGEFAVAFVDMVMPIMDGVELTQRLIAVDPEVVVVLVTAYYSQDNLRKFFAAGGSYSLEKPLGANTFYETVKRALLCRSPQAIRNALGILCDDPGSLMWSLDGASQQLRSILSQVGDVHNRAHSLLHHQAIGISVHFVASMRPGCDVTGLLSRLRGQLACIERLSKVVGRLKKTELHSYLADYIADLRILYPNIEFALECAPDASTPVAMQHGGVVVLIVAELIDNAISALNGSGTIETKISALRSSGLVQVTVRDSGPGIPQDLVERAFDEGVSTKGPGRGLGLALVRGAAMGLGGDIRYEKREGTTFRVVIPAT